jgi:Protein of unknown function (DUF2703).
MSTNPSQSRHLAASNRRVIEVDLLALDLNTCTRCLRTLANIETAIETLKPVLEATWTEMRFRKIRIESQEQARQHRFVSSPTIRINGRDIVFETLESKCDSCTELCGCEEGTSCRIWRYRGEEYTEAPIGLIVEALLNHMSGTETPTVTAPPYEGVPENLRRFFLSQAQRPAVAEACCSPKEQVECCETDEKVSCCGGPEPRSCGCR